MNTLNRRQFITLAGLGAGAALLGGCKPAQLLDEIDPQFGTWPSVTSEADWRLLNRLTFGPRPQERSQLREIGAAAFIEEQLAPDTLPAISLAHRFTLRRLESLSLDAADLFDIEEENVKRELQQAALLRAIYNPHQLYEVMVDFWTNHFHIDQNKMDCAWLKTVDDREVIRPHALGNFYDLLSASAHSPAMLFYLDNQENHAGNPNENYARELLELHTLSVNSSYTQTDVQALARCLTGWTIKDYFYRGHFTFAEEQHDNSAKTILGIPLPAGSKQAGGEKIIEMLATHPDTARFIATKLVRRFVADDPPQDLVNKATQTFLDTQGEIKPVLRTILLSPEMLHPEQTPPAKKLKRPLEYVASALRQLNVQTDAGQPLLVYLAQMGQPLFQWPTPDGFPDHADFWQGSLMTRWHFALALVNGDIPETTLDIPTLLEATGVQTQTARLSQLATLLLGQPFAKEIAHNLLQISSSEELFIATLLGAPAFQWR